MDTQLSSSETVEMLHFNQHYEVESVPDFAGPVVEQLEKDLTC